jgi:hypothetical protein
MVFYSDDQMNDVFFCNKGRRRIQCVNYFFQILFISLLYNT